MDTLDNTNNVHEQLIDTNVSSNNVDLEEHKQVQEESKPIVYDAETRSKMGNMTSYVGMATNIFLVICKFIMGELGHSSAMVADAIHSLTDLFSDFATWLVLTLAKKPADADHPYGHGRYEITGSVLISILLIVVGAGIGYESITKLVSQEETIVEMIALYAAIISLVANEGLFWYAYLIGKKINSQVVIANAWHHRADAIASIVAFVGIILNICFKWWWADPAAGICVALMIIYVGISIGYKGICSLADRMPPEAQAQINTIVEQIPAVDGYSDIRVREMGPYYIVDLKVHVHPGMTVGEAQTVIAQVSEEIKMKMTNVSEVLVNLVPSNPEDELISSRSLIKNINQDIHNLKGLKSIDTMSISQNEPFNIDISISTEDEITPEERSQILAKAKNILSSYKNVSTSNVSLTSQHSNTEKESTK